MGLFDRIFGSGSASGDKEFSKVKTKSRTSESDGKTTKRTDSILMTGDKKGSHEHAWSKTTTDKSGNSRSSEGAHGDKFNETRDLMKTPRK